MAAPLRWTVRAGDGPRVADVLARMGDPTAAAEGRAQHDGRRAAGAELVAPGDVIEVFAGRSAANEPVRILEHRQGLIVAYKPAGLPTTADRRGASSLVSELARELGEEPHPASRLDVGVSGAVLCAVGPSARRHVAAAKEAGRVRRVYVGLAGGAVAGAGLWDAPIGHRRGPGGRNVPTAGGEGCEPAATRFAQIASGRPARPGGARTTLLRLEPVTGRMHQLRVHAAHAGAPILGDRERDGARTLVAASGAVTTIDRVALHALLVELEDERGEPFATLAPLPAALRALWSALDGAASAWDEVLGRSGDA